MNQWSRMLSVAAFCLLTVPAIAESAPQVHKTHVATASQSVNGSVPADKELASKYRDFENFAQKKIRQLNSNHRLSRSRMQITKQRDGTYLARYHEIDHESLDLKVRRSQSKSTPYVGIISYHEQVYESSLNDPKHVNGNPFAVVEIIPNRHIFSYRKGEWR